MKLLDARTPGEIDGKDLRNIKRGGFIESSVPVYWEDTLDPATKTFKPAAAIAKLYRDKGILPSDDVTMYCQVGMRASHDLFTLALIGHDISKLRELLRVLGRVGQSGRHAHKNQVVPGA